MAADLPVYKARPPVIASYSWTGCYAGGNVGGVWINKEWFSQIPGDPSFGQSFGSHDANGWLGGVQAGCNYQVGSWVVGIQGDYDWTNASGSNGNRSCGGDAEGLLERLHELRELDEGHLLERVEEVRAADLRHGGVPS